MAAITLNGESKEIPDGLTLSGLLDRLKIKQDRVAVERNREIVPRSDWETVRIAPGDQLEIVHFVGGGAGR